MDAQIRKIRGETIDLRPTTEEDLPALLALWNDGRVMRWVGFPEGLGYDSARMSQWFERLSRPPRRRHFIIESSVLGFCGEAFYRIDAVHRRAGLDLKLRPEAQGGGRAAAALQQLIRCVFDDEPEADLVWTEPWRNNLAAHTLYWSCGLRPSERPADLEPGPSFWTRRRQRASAG